MKKSIILASVLSVFMLAGISCSSDYNSIKRMQKLEEGVDHPVTKEELKEAIDKYDKRAMDLVLTQSQEGMWYKILGTRYLDEQMYSQAYDAFQKALNYYPDNANLYYYLAICAGYIANTQLDFDAKGGNYVQEKKMNYLKTSEQAYLQALSIDPDYYRAMYGIGVLYVFELNECEKAIPYLEKYLETQVKETNAMFVLARAYFVTGEYNKAVDCYDRIIKINPNAERTAEAQANKQKVLDAEYSN